MVNHKKIWSMSTEKTMVNYNVVKKEKEKMETNNNAISSQQLNVSVEGEQPGLAAVTSHSALPVASRNRPLRLCLTGNWFLNRVRGLALPTSN